MAVKWTAVDADVDDDAVSITLIRSSVMPQRRAALSDVITHSGDAAVTHSRHESRNVKRRATHFPVLPVAVRRNGTAPHYGADSRLDDDDRKWQASAGLPQSVRSVRRSAILDRSLVGGRQVGGPHCPPARHVSTFYAAAPAGKPSSGPAATQPAAAAAATHHNY